MWRTSLDARGSSRFQLRQLVMLALLSVTPF